MKKGFHFSGQISQEESENILPLINVVFLLLIFFLLAGTFATPDLFYVEPPVSQIDNPDSVSDMTILIDTDGVIGFENEHVSVEELALRVKSVLEKQPHQPFRIKAAAHTRSGQVITVMEILRESGAGQTMLVTTQQQAP